MKPRMFTFAIFYVDVNIRRFGQKMSTMPTSSGHNQHTLQLNPDKNHRCTKMILNDLIMFANQRPFSLMHNK